MLNASWEALTFQLPAVPGPRARWRRCIDTSLASPDDVRRWEEAPPVEAAAYVVQPRTIALIARAARSELAGP